MIPPSQSCPTDSLRPQRHPQFKAEMPLIEQVVQRQFGLVDLEPLALRSWNAHFRARGSDGLRHVKVVRIPGPEEDLINQFGYTAELLQRLQDLGCPYVIPPLRSVDGSFSAQAAGWLVCAFPWNEHLAKEVLSEEGCQTAPIIGRAALMLVHLHDLSTSLMLNAACPQRRSPYAYSPAEWRQHSRRLWVIAECKLRHQRASEHTLMMLRQAQRATQRLFTECPPFFQAPPSWVVVHGDYRPENLTIGLTAESSWICDFDHAHPSCREVDAAYGALSFAGPRWFTGRRDWSACALFLREYEAGLSRGRLGLEAVSIALRYVLLKALSLSFKEEQVRDRFPLYLELCTVLNEGLIG